MGIEVCKNKGFEYRHYEEVESGVKGGLGRKYFKKMMSLVEEGVLDGLNWIEGKVIKFKLENLEKGSPMPHMGWNQLHLNSKDELIEDLHNEMFYFLHSYYLEPEDKNCILSTTNYGSSFCAVIKNENIYGMQCHPEKSHSSGIRFLKNFSNLS